MKRLPVSLSLYFLSLSIFSAVQAAPAIRESNRWLAESTMQTARAGACSVMLTDGRVLVAGGENAASPLATAEFFSGSGNFSTAAPMLQAHSFAVCAALPDGKVLVAGGRTSGGGVSSGAEIYDPQTDTWTAIVGMTTPRTGATATQLKDGRILIAGGEAAGRSLATLEIFDPATLTFEFAPALLIAARKGHAAAGLPDGRVLIIGGAGEAGDLATSEIFDSETGRIAPGPEMSVPRSGLTATELLDGRVVAIGGSDAPHADIFDPAKGVFEPAGAMKTPRRDHQAFRIPGNNSVLLAGGTSAGVPTQAAELFIPWRNSFEPIGSLTTPRTAATGSPLKRNGVVMMAGGSTGFAASSSAETVSVATITTDKLDYAPGETVYITGTGWQPGETVRLLFHEEPTTHADLVIQVIADSSGNITAQYLVEEHDYGVTFYLTATGLTSGRTAQTIFTDGSINLQTIDITAPSGALDKTLSGGQTFTVTASIKAGKVGWNAISVFPITSGWSGTGNLASLASDASADISFTVTAPTTPGTTNVTFKVQATPSSGNCTGPPSNHVCFDTKSINNITVVNAATLSIPAMVSSQTGTPGDTIVRSGQSVTTTLTTSNGAAPRATANTVAASFSVSASGSAAATGCTPPGTTSVAAGATGTFTYVCTTVSGDGKLTFSGSASGTDENSGNTVASGSSNGNEVIVDSTAPVTGLTPASGSHNAPFSFSWNASDPTAGGVSSGIATCSVLLDSVPVSSACSGNQSVAAGAHTVSVTVTDVAGNSTIDNRNYTVVPDFTPPVVTISFPAVPASGWFTSASVPGSVSATDANSNVSSISCSGATLGAISNAGTPTATASLTVTGEGTHNVICTATDSSGNSGAAAGSVNSQTVKIDSIKPVITGSATVTGGANYAAGTWTNLVVTVVFTCADAGGSGVGANNVAGATVSAEGANQSVTNTGTCTDVAGNTANPATFSNINIDKTKPVITAAATTPPGGAAYTAGTWTNKDVQLAFTCADSGGSGIATNTVAGSTLSGSAADQSVTNSGACTDNAGNTADAATFSNIDIDKVEPTLTFGSANPAANGAGWNNTNVTFSYTAADALSGVATSLPASPLVLTAEGASVTSTVTVTDMAGNSRTFTSPEVKIDKTKPTLVFAAASPAANLAGWNNTDLSFAYTASDALSGVATQLPASPLVLIIEGSAVTGTVTVTDAAGNSETFTSPAVKIDKTKPTASAISAPAANVNGWNNTDVTVSFTGADGLSGISSCSTAMLMSAEGAGQTSGNGTCTDNAGNVSDPVSKSGINIDKTKPTLSFAAANPAANGAGWNNTNVTIGYTPGDALSGVDTSLPASPLVLTAEGDSVTGTVTVTDKAGNSETFTSPAVKIDKTNPLLVLGPQSPAANGMGWNNSDVSIPYTTSDALSGVATSLPASPLVLTTEGMAVTGSVTLTDKAGNSETFTSPAVKIDKTNPLAFAIASPAPNAAGWNNSDVTVTFTGTDGMSGITSCTAPVVISIEGAGQTSPAGTCVDNAGNTSAPVAKSGINIDKTKPGLPTAIVATPNPAAVRSSITLNATIADALASGYVAAAEYSLDGGAYVPMSAADGSFSSPTENVRANFVASSTAGVSSLCVRGTDAAGNTGDPDCVFFVVYDPNGGFVTGGGWINSPAGAYPANPTLAGKANFGFVSKYQKGATVPTGETEFNFKVANFNFHSVAYEWLVVGGARAQYKGTGTVNRTGNYGFLLTAIDGQVAGGGGLDKFRVKIWDKNNLDQIVYDNELGISDGSDPTTLLGGGSITLHTK